MLKFLVALLVFFLSFLPSTSKTEKKIESLKEYVNGTQNREIARNLNDFFVTEKIDDFKKLSTSAAASYLVDERSGLVLYEKNSNQKLPPASLAKLMTAIVVVSEANLSEIVTVKKQKTQPLDSTMWLVTGDKLSVEDLLHGLLINSGSDAALNLAEHVSGDSENFVALMNEKAKNLGLTETQFTNPVGWDEPGNFSTAKDLTNLSRIALKNQKIKEIVNKKSYNARALNGRLYPLYNTNILISQPGFYGVKTGTTYDAGQCLTFIYDNDKTTMVGTVLNSKERFIETESLIRWAKGNYIFN